MVSRGAEPPQSCLRSIKIVRSKIDVVKFDMVLDMRSNWVNMQSAKVLAKFFLSLRSDVLEVLFTEDYNATLSNQESKLILLDISKSGKLKT